MASPPIEVDSTTAVARLTLNRPERRNALSREMLSWLQRELAVLSESRLARVVVLDANGPVFSAGHDLAEMERLSASEVTALFELCSSVMEGLARLRQPVIASVRGLATAAGCQLVASCDLVIASEKASFATPGVNIGLFCSTPAVPLVRCIGRRRALEMLLGGSAIDAPTAADWGLVNRVVAPADLDAAVTELAQRIAQASPDTIALGKRTFYEQLDLAERQAYELASRRMAENAVAPDAREGMRAFLEKRAPIWKQTDKATRVAEE